MQSFKPLPSGQRFKDLRDHELSFLKLTPLYPFCRSGHGHTWSSDHRFFYLAERHASKDSVAIYDTTDSWKLVHVRSSHL